MKLYYYKDDMENFGDDLNQWLWPKVLPHVLNDDESHLMLGIGSILNHKLPYAQKYTVVGSGWGYGKAPKIDENWNIVCLRGKISCQKLGLDPDLGIIDPAYLLQDFFTDIVKKKYPISLIPHAKSLEVGRWQDICGSLGIHLIDPRTTDVEGFVAEVRSSEKVLTEAMHGAIISDCFGIPWLGYSAYDYINGVKWNDWLSVLGHEVNLTRINSLYKGYEGRDLPFKVKNEIKLKLKKIGIWKDCWYPPIPRKTSKNEEKKIAKQLQQLIDTGQFFYSDRELVTCQLNKLKAKLANL